MLSIKDAQAVIDAVKADSEAVRRIQSDLTGPVIATLGLAGSIRNIYYIARSLGDPSVEDTEMVCVGIADQSAAAINKGVKARVAGLRNIAKASTVSRVHNLTHHVATSVTVKSGRTYVFDWHQTLDVDNPKLFADVLRWKIELQAETFRSFEGFR